MPYISYSTASKFEKIQTLNSIDAKKNSLNPGAGKEDRVSPRIKPGGAFPNSMAVPALPGDNYLGAVARSSGNRAITFLFPSPEIGSSPR